MSPRSCARTSTSGREGAAPLTDDPTGVVEEFTAKVLPQLDEITQVRTDFDLTEIDLILTVEGQALTFT